MNNKKNYINYSLGLMSLLIPALIALSAIPEEWTDQLNLRHMDILSDIRKPPATQTDSLVAVMPIVIPPFVDTCRHDLTCFDDFTENGTGLTHFFSVLNQIDSLNRPVRIAFFGDSYIEGDIFTSDLRELLQSEFGGSGVGFVGASSITAGFRQTVVHKFGSWQAHSLVDTVSKDYSKMGMAGSYFVPTSKAWVQYTGVQKKGLDTFNRARLLFSLKSGTANISYKLNGLAAETVTLTAANEIQEHIIDAKMRSLQINFTATNQLNVFGTSLEDQQGIILDNFSLRGMPGTSLSSIPAKNLRQFDSLLSYDLIVLQYGLNAMMPKTVNYTTYANNMIKTVNHIKTNFPNASILLLSVGDRSMKTANGFTTMPGVPAMVAFQKSVCAETNIVFWNMFEAMGGSGSMVQLVQSKPAKANKDYTHLTFAGGKHMAEILYSTLLYEKEKFDRKQKHANTFH